MDINSINALGSTPFMKQAGEIGMEESKINDFKDIFESAKASGSDEKIKEAAKTFESYFINTIYKQMRSTINYSGGLFERSSAEKMFQEMLDEEYSEIATQSGGIGLADAIYEQMKEQ